MLLRWEHLFMGMEGRDFLSDLLRFGAGQSGKMGR